MIGHLLFFVISLLQLFLTQSRTLAIIGGNTTIGVYEVNGNAGNLTKLSQVNLFSPSPWIAVYPPKNPSLVLATGNNTIVLYGLNSQTGTLTKLSEQSSGGINPAFVTWDSLGRYAVVANYGFNDSDSTGSNAAVLPVVQSSNGSFVLQTPSAIVAHNGSSVDPARQTGSHTHSIYVDPSGRYAFACDLGLDKIWQYLFPENGYLPVNPVAEFVQPASLGAGPRHLAWHPDNLNVFLINEMGSTIDNFNYQSNTGTLVGPFSSISTLPADYVGTSAAAEIAITPNGRFLYASNRGYDSIVGYIIDVTNTDFPLKLVGYYTQNVVWPRTFAIDPTGTLLFVGSANSNNVVTFAINQENGVLTPTGAQTSFPLPEAIQIVSVPDFEPTSHWGLVTHAFIATMIFSIIFAIFILSTLLRSR